MDDTVLMEMLERLQGIGVGFVDGDIEIVYKKE